MTNTEEQKAKANAFRALHRGGKVLVLPNAWDVASVRVFEEAGFPAIATTSAGIAFSLGYPDGQKISREEMLARVTRVARAVKVPVTADVEAGYGEKPQDAARTACALIEAGAVGMNLEDATSDPQQPLVELPLQIEKIRAIREAAMKVGMLLVLNARTDVYLAEVGAPAVAIFRGGQAVDGVSRRRCRLRIRPRSERASDDCATGERCSVSVEHSCRPGIAVGAGTRKARRGASERGIRTDAGHVRTA